jgi:hypothetical protein
MKIHYQIHECETELFYGETISRLLKSFEVHYPVILVTNQSCYDELSEKVRHMFSEPERVNWYICSNDPHCNQLDELRMFMKYLLTLPRFSECQLIGLGNVGVCQMTAFYQQVGLQKSECWLIPTSMTALSRILSGVHQIEIQYNQAVMSVNVLPRYTVVDSSIMKSQQVNLLADLFQFIQVGLVSDYKFLKKLYTNYSTPKKLRQLPMVGLTEELVDAFEKHGEAMGTIDLAIQRSFNHVPYGHLVSEDNRRAIACVIHLLYSMRANSFNFRIENFMRWLLFMGYGLDLPRELMLTEFVEQIKLESVSAPVRLLKNIGELGEFITVDEVELMKILEEYTQMIDRLMIKNDVEQD